jgi:hypothetical protein
MTEILWKSSAPHLPVQDHELVEIRMVELDSNANPRYLVREIHASWSASDQQMKWMGFHDMTFGTRREAQQSFASREESIIKAGYPYRTLLN